MNTIYLERLQKMLQKLKDLVNFGIELVCGLGIICLGMIGLYLLTFLVYKYPTFLYSVTH